MGSLSGWKASVRIPSVVGSAPTARVRGDRPASSRARRRLRVPESLGSPGDVEGIWKPRMSPRPSMRRLRNRGIGRCRPTPRPVGYCRKRARTGRAPTRASTAGVGVLAASEAVWTSPQWWLRRGTLDAARTLPADTSSGRKNLPAPGSTRRTSWGASIGTVAAHRRLPHVRWVSINARHDDAPDASLTRAPSGVDGPRRRGDSLTDDEHVRAGEPRERVVHGETSPLRNKHRPACSMSVLHDRP